MIDPRMKIALLYVCEPQASCLDPFIFCWQSRYAKTQTSVFPSNEKRPIKESKVNCRQAKRLEDHIDTFFAEYSDFEYDSSAPIWTGFNRMCNAFGWDSDDYEMREAKRDFREAMVKQFNDIYGTDQEDLSSWQNLCHVLNIEPAPTRLKECREVRTTEFILLVRD